VNICYLVVHGQTHTARQTYSKKGSQMFGPYISRGIAW